MTTLLDIAKNHEGVSERPGKAAHPLIQWWLSLCDGMGDGEDDETAWCSAFVNGMCHALGLDRSHKANARSWLRVGKPVELSDARPGDVCVFWRTAVDSWQGHVAIFESVSADGRAIRVWGGNQGNRVCGANYPTDRLLGIRRISARRVA